MITIRPYTPADRADVADICVRTADGGSGAAGLYSSDTLIPDIYALPYVDREPELAFVADNGERAVGFVLGTADTVTFADWFTADWWPTRARQYSGTTKRERALVAAAEDSNRMLGAGIDEYPAHLHINLLPEAQGHGLGRQLIESLAEALVARGIRGLHLVVGATNTDAQAFYRRVGFTELAADADGVTMGKKLS